MHVIKYGKNVDTNRFTCDNCNSVIAYSKIDIRTEERYIRVSVDVSNSVGQEYVICPLCGVRFIINEW